MLPKMLLHVACINAWVITFLDLMSVKALANHSSRPQPQEDLPEKWTDLVHPVHPPMQRTGNMPAIFLSRVGSEGFEFRFPSRMVAFQFLDFSITSTTILL